MDITEKKIILGRKIRIEREKLGLTQEKFGALINLDPTNLSRLEKGKSFPDFTTFCSIIEACKIEPNYLLDFIQFTNKEVTKEDIEISDCLKIIPQNTKKALNQLIITLAE